MKFPVGPFSQIWILADAAFFKGFFITRPPGSVSSLLFWNVLPQKGRGYPGDRMTGAFSPLSRKPLWVCPSLKRTVATGMIVFLTTFLTVTSKLSFKAVLA